MSICVAVGNKVMDTRLPQPAGCGDKYDVSGWCWRRLFSAFCKFFKYPSPADKPAPSPSGGEEYRLHRPWCNKILGTRPRMTGGRGANSFGRSMIEMLGVLAIIGVLSVGGIAGYSKAMENFKVNKIVSEYNMLVQGLIEHKINLRKTSANINELVLALNLVPNTWTINGNYLTDSYGNQMIIGYRSANNERPWDDAEKSGVYIDYFLGALSKDEQGSLKSESFSDKICFELFNNAIKPLHNMVNAGWVNSGKNYYKNSFYYGDSYCSSNRNCLRDITLDQIKTICNSCDKLSYCNVTIIF